MCGSVFSKKKSAKVSNQIKLRSNNKICFKLNYSFCCVVCFIFMKEIAFEKTIVLNDVNMISRTTFINVSKIVLTSIEI